MLAHKLERAGYAPAAVEAALARATTDGYLDDDEYARALVRRRQVGRGRAMIAQELRAKGIGGGVLEQALGEADPADEAEHARVIARAILRLKPPADRAQLRATVGARLGRRGFSSGVISRVLRELAAELNPVRAERFDTPSEPD
jgi:regulatory protein